MAKLPCRFSGHATATATATALAVVGMQDSGTVALAAVGRSTRRIKLSRFCRTLELKRTPYQYIEIDPFEKPDWFLAMHPRGIVPLLRHGDWVCYESSVILEYIEELNMAPALLPLDRPQQRADCRMSPT
ncbi:MAG: hypothetical protein M1815_005706 [Lichina confinis]|nr:MAG: hypothetical protein M1815_005706 [Lichina confinis]